MVDPMLFKVMADQVKDYALFLLDPRGHVLSWNAGAHQIKGYEAEEIIGRHFSTFYPSEAIARGWPQEELRRATREGRFEDEGWRVRKDGSLFWANVVITALRDANGKLLAFSKITRDLTDRRQQEDAVRQSEERFRLLVEGVADYAIYMLDPEGFVASWNLGAQRIKGYDASDVIGRHFSNFFTPEDVEAGKPWEELASARSGGRAEAEGWRVRKDGSRFWARAVVTALHDATGRLRGFSKVTQDLSQRRQIQELEQAAERVQEFIAMLAHEIRNPLAPIHNAIHVMARTKLEDPAQLRMLEIIGRQAAQLGRIADDMLDISRVTQGKMVIQRVPVDIAEVVERAIDVAAPLIEAARHRLQVEMAAERRRVIGDQDRLVQVFSNLLNNSARYTPPGGSIAISVATEAEDVVVRVTDNGRGIDPSRLKSIFQMFVQEREPISRVGEGLGVGLALARSIVELHGGAIEARSDGAGKGSEFVVRLPRAAPHEATEPSAATKQHAPRAAAARSRRVLVVDDNADAAATLDMLLKALGHEARIARDGAEALAAFEAFRPDIVLLDIGLPGISGYEVARRLRRRGSTARIIAVTGWGQPKDREESAQAGIDLHLVKPIDAEQLQRVLAPERGGCNGTLH